jgi:sec-independent protein translocase protein TatB
MFGLSFWEIAIIMVIALVVLGPSKLPEIARNLGKGLREFRKATEDFKSTVSDEMSRPESPRYQLPPDTPAQIIPPTAPPAPAPIATASEPVSQTPAPSSDPK